MAKLLVWTGTFGAEVDTTSRFYKNCQSVRKRGGKICQSCPFREWIERAEKRAKSPGANIGKAEEKP